MLSVRNYCRLGPVSAGVSRNQKAMQEIASPIRVEFGFVIRCLFGKLHMIYAYSMIQANLKQKRRNVLEHSTISLGEQIEMRREFNDPINLVLAPKNYLRILIHF